MRWTTFVVFVGVLLTLAVFSQPASAGMDFQISCEGTESTGGGTYTYQYTLRNITAVSVTLTDLFVGTEDATAGNYTFIPTTGFTASIVPNNGSLTNILYGTNVKTPHGTVPTASETACAAIIYWSGSVVVTPGGTVTFAYDHPQASVDNEWHANSSAGWTISQYSSPIAGPTGTYTDGYVHAPCGRTRAPALSGWGIVLLVVLTLLVATWVLVRLRRRVPETV